MFPTGFLRYVTTTNSVFSCIFKRNKSLQTTIWNSETMWPMIIDHDHFSVTKYKVLSLDCGSLNSIKRVPLNMFPEWPCQLGFTTADFVLDRHPLLRQVGSGSPFHWLQVLQSKETKIRICKTLKKPSSWKYFQSCLIKFSMSMSEGSV